VIAAQFAPALSQDCQRYAYFIGFEPVHEPALAVRRLPTFGVPETAGGDVFAGARVPDRRNVAAEAVVVRKSSSARLQRNWAVRRLVIWISLRRPPARLVEVHQSR
jgi:hypothetical protein